MTLGSIIQSNRQRLGISQEQLAEQVGVSRQAVSKWEVGDAIPDTDKLIPLARALGITVDELLGNVTETQSAPVSGVTAQEKRPGWFAAHWYYLGLLPVIWGIWQLILLLIMVLSIAGTVDMGAPMLPTFENFKITTSAGAIPIL